MESEHFHCEAIASRVYWRQIKLQYVKRHISCGRCFLSGCQSIRLNDMFSYFNIMFALFFQFCASFCDFLQVCAIFCKFLRFSASFCGFLRLFAISSRCIISMWEREKIKLPEVLKRSLSENDEENEVSNKATKFCLEFCNPLLRFCCSQVDKEHSRRGRGLLHSTEVAFLPLIQRPGVWFSVHLKIYFVVAEIHRRHWFEESGETLDTVEQTRGGTSSLFLAPAELWVSSSNGPNPVKISLEPASSPSFLLLKMLKFEFEPTLSLSEN